VAGEQGDLDAAKEARMLSDRLGLNPLALSRLRLEIEHADEVVAKGEERRRKQAPKRSDEDDPRRGLFAV
jgi:hypothetical protein